MYKFIGGMVSGMTIVPFFYLAEKHKHLGWEFSIIPILIALSIVIGTWIFSSKADEHDLSNQG